jgi:hypothetical protein
MTRSNDPYRAAVAGSTFVVLLLAGAFGAIFLRPSQ